MKFDQSQHRKQLRSILEFIASSALNNEQDAASECSHVCATQDFLKQIQNNDDDEDASESQSSSFQFYNSNENRHQQSTSSSTILSSILTPSKKQATADRNNRLCWLKLSRMTGTIQIPLPSRVVRRFLNIVLNELNSSDGSLLLTRDDLLQRSEIDWSLWFSHVYHSQQQRSQQLLEGKEDVKQYLRSLRAYHKRKRAWKEMDRIYNRLFELSQINHDIVWGFGRAVRHSRAENDNEQYHLLEVRCEVELTNDGSLCIMPCEHGGVALSRQFVAMCSRSREATETNHGNISLQVTSLHQLVRDLEAKDLCPAHPQSYHHILKQAATYLSAAGSFRPFNELAAADMSAVGDANELRIDDTWCIFHRSKPNRIWARDAQLLAEELSKSEAEFPLAAVTLTHGPNVLPESIREQDGFFRKRMRSIIEGLFGSRTNYDEENEMNFPLPISKSQKQITELLFCGKPAVVVEGPPGSGKTHSIANIVCAYLAQGKRVLVTSKGSSALSVLRERIPASVRTLCVDLSMSESKGKQQLQQTIEFLCERVASGSGEKEIVKEIEDSIGKLQAEICGIDSRLNDSAERQREFLRSNDGSELVRIAVQLHQSAPWLARIIPRYAAADLKNLLDLVRNVAADEEDEIFTVSGFTSPPADSTISAAASRAGYFLPSLASVFKSSIVSIPYIGDFSGLKVNRASDEAELGCILIRCEAATNKSDWSVIHRALQRDKDLHEMYRNYLSPLIESSNWPDDIVSGLGTSSGNVRGDLVHLLELAIFVREAGDGLDIQSLLNDADISQSLEKDRQAAVLQIQSLSQRLAQAKTFLRLSETFSPEAQSALIRFTQLALKNRFIRIPEIRMSQRQQRRRREYVEAFEKCVPYIPCWIMTSAQVSEYLPPTCIFDLVIIDEASQSDISALPCMLRGRQWLIVGDGKQVSPTENFIKEDMIESLRVTLPSSPFQECLLPGHSFFDFCNQAFPLGRVVLTEHFRSAPEIIYFCNNQFYNKKLSPLRVPTTSERLVPSIVDVPVDGIKQNKCNLEECRVIVEMIRDFINDSAPSNIRSIGVISLIGDEQSRLIRNHLLDEIGPDKMKLHGILVGTPPAFQGTERDIIFLSMICSPGHVPTQCQLMHAQRINVAMSRARDRLILVRSINACHIPNSDDVKIPVLEFFETFGAIRDCNNKAKEQNH